MTPPNKPISTSYTLTSLFVILFLLFATSGVGHTLTLHAARATAAERRVERKVDMLLAIRADQERRHVHDLLANANVTLADEHTRVVHRLGEAELEHESLQAALQELLRTKGKHVIELVLSFIL